MTRNPDVRRTANRLPLALALTALLVACGAPPRQPLQGVPAPAAPEMLAAPESPPPPPPPVMPHLAVPVLSTATVTMPGVAVHPAPSPAAAYLKHGAVSLRAASPGLMPEQRERYAHVEPNPVRMASRDPVSTFSLDVDTASYANVRRFLRHGELPPEDAVRVEELVNYFP